MPTQHTFACLCVSITFQCVITWGLPIISSPPLTGTEVFAWMVLMFGVFNPIRPYSKVSRDFPSHLEWHHSSHGLQSLAKFDFLLPLQPDVLSFHLLTHPDIPASLLPLECGRGCSCRRTSPLNDSLQVLMSPALHSILLSYLSVPSSEMPSPPFLFLYLLFLHSDVTYSLLAYLHLFFRM